MKSSTRNLIIVGAAALVLGGAVFALNKVGGTSSSSSSTASTETIKLISKTSSDVTSMKVTNKNGSYTLTPLPTGTVGSSSASSSSLNFTVKELEGCPVNTDSTNAVVQNGFSLGAMKNIGQVKNMSDYGLTSPQATVEVTYKDGSTFGYKIGNATASNTGAYYMCGLNSDNVYVVAVDNGILQNAAYFVKKEMLAITPDASASSSSDSQQQNDFQKITLTGKNFPKETVIQPQSDGMPTIVAPAKYEVDAQNVANMEGVLSTLTADSAVVARPDAAALTKYGFDNPTVKAVFTANKKENHTLILGGKSSKGYYAMVDNVNVIYEVTSDNVSALTSMTLFNLRSKLIFLPNITTVKHIDITSAGKTDTIDVTRTENAASSTKDNKAYDYKVTGTNGAALKYDPNYKNAYQTLIGLVIFDETQTMPTGTPAITVKYSYFDKSSTSTLALYKINDRQYTAVLDGTPYGLCSKSDVENILETITAFEAGKTVVAS